MAVAQMPDDESHVFSNIGDALFMRPENADVFFVFESGERVPAHKLLLSTVSDVFATMFHGSLKEEGEIKIVDTSPEAFKEFLRIFYSNNVVLSGENVAEVMYLGNKYNVPECLKLCAKLLRENITTENAVNVLGLSILNNRKKLIKMCASIIRRNSADVLQSKSFGECDRMVLKHILEMDGLMCSETIVFNACMSWVKATSGQETLTRDIVKSHLGELFYAIRFGSMTMTEFVSLLPSYGILFSAEEYTEILQMIHEIEIEPTLFKKCKRCYLWSENAIVECNRTNGYVDAPFSIRKEEVTMFSTNCPLLLGYISSVPIMKKNRRLVEKIKIDATIIALFGNKLETQSSFSYTSDGDRSTVYLPAPILIRPNIIYEMKLTYPSADYCSYLTVVNAVSINSEIKVEFVYDRVVNERYVGVIDRLGFNPLQ